MGDHLLAFGCNAAHTKIQPESIGLTEFRCPKCEGTAILSSLAVGSLCTCALIHKLDRFTCDECKLDVSGTLFSIMWDRWNRKELVVHYYGAKGNPGNRHWVMGDDATFNRKQKATCPQCKKWLKDYDKKHTNRYFKHIRRRL